MRTAVILLVVLSAPVAAQWLNHPDPTTPRTRDGKPDLSARMPRASNGKPDLSGVWAPEPSEAMKEQLRVDDANPLGADGQFISQYALNVLSDFKPDGDLLRPKQRRC